MLTGPQKDLGFLLFFTLSGDSTMNSEAFGLQTVNDCCFLGECGASTLRVTVQNQQSMGMIKIFNDAWAQWSSYVIADDSNVEG